MKMVQRFGRGLTILVLLANGGAGPHTCHTVYLPVVLR